MYGFFCLAAGALFFIPAALNRTYWIFLIGLFTMGTGLSVLQAAANPYITIIGPIETAARRISIMGVCNKFAGIVSPIIFAAVVLGKSQDILESVESGLLSGIAKEAALNELIRGVILPYSILSLLLLFIGLFIYKSKLPDINPEEENEEVATANCNKTSVFQFPYLILGVCRIFSVRHLLYLKINPDNAKRVTREIPPTTSSPNWKIVASIFHTCHNQYGGRIFI